MSITQRNLRSEAPIRIQAYPPNGADVITYGTVSFVQEKVTKTDTVKRPKPVDLFAAGTPFQVTVETWYSGTASLRSGKITYFAYPSISVPRGGGLDGPNANALNNELLGKIKALSVNASVMLPEMGKTTDMVTGLARDMLGTFRKLRSGRLFSDFIRDLAAPKDRASKKLAKRWLEYTYGITPTLSDIHGLSVAMHSRVTEGKRMKAVVSRTTQKQFLVPYDYYCPQLSVVDSLNQKATAYYTLSSAGLKTLAQVGITNPALTAWELMPYSFVIDWVIGIGDYLNTLDALVGVSDIKFVTSHRFERTCVGPYYAYGTSNGSQAATVMSVLIEKHRSGATNMIPAQLPGYQPHLTMSRMVSSVALLRNLIK